MKQMGQAYIQTIIILTVFSSIKFASAQEQISKNIVCDPVKEATWPAIPLPRPISPDAIPVTVDFDQLRKLVPGDSIALRYPGHPFTARIDQVRRQSPKSWSLVGRLDGDPDGIFILCVEEDALVGLIQSSQSDKVYQISYVAQGVHEFGPVVTHQIVDCKTGTGGPPPAGSAPQGQPHEEDGGPVPHSACNSPARNSDVMIYYTPSARLEAGGVNAMNAQCQLAVETANQTYVDSQIGNHLTLVFCGEIVYTESGDLETDRNRLHHATDGFMDNVQGERNFYGADFVTVFVRHSDADACGIAYCTPPDSEWGLCIVDWTCASNSYSYAHELGHLQGCAHNLEDAGSGCNEYFDSFGYRFYGNSGLPWRTVMAYNNGANEFPNRIPRWSNPNVLYDGQPCGVEWQLFGTFNAATVSATAWDRENWRNPRFDVWVALSSPAPLNGTFVNPLPTVNQGVNAIFGGDNPLVTPVLHIKTQTYLETVTISKRMSVIPCGGPVRIGG